MLRQHHLRRPGHVQLLGNEAQINYNTPAGSQTKKLLRVVLPMIAMNLMRFPIVGASVFSLGGLGTTELAAANVGQLTSNILAFGPILGLVAALDTLSNAASTSEYPYLTSLYAMRTFVVCMSYLPFIFGTCWNADVLFRLLIPSSDEHMRELAALYTSIFAEHRQN